MVGWTKILRAPRVTRQTATGCGVPLPGHGRLLRLQARKVWRRSAPEDDPVGEGPRLSRLLCNEPGAKIIRFRHGGGEPDRLQPGRKFSEPRQVEREEIAALGDD